MNTQCTPKQLEFHAFGRRAVVGQFNGGRLTSEGGGILLREVDRCLGLMPRIARCFTDHRDPAKTEHSVRELVAQRVYGIALGYEDLNDHDGLRADSLLALMVGKSDPTGATRSRERDRGCPLAGSSTLNRLELSHPEAAVRDRYRRIAADADALDRVLVDLFLDAHTEAPEELWLDLDATDDPLHGTQEGRFFHGYYKNYCYLPLYIFCGEHLLCARLRPSNRDASAGSVEELTRIVGRIRARWPDVRLVIRGDSGFCREGIMAWCEENEVDYVLGLARNNVLEKRIAKAQRKSRSRYVTRGKASRRFREFRYRTLDSWSRSRRVVAKAEHLAKGSNPRFVVTSLSPKEVGRQRLYETLYCARGDMENRIKEQQLDLFADRTSSHTMRANQLRLYFASFAYVLMHSLRRLALVGTSWARMQCGTLRVKLLKIAARVRITARKVWLSFSSAYPYRAEFAAAAAALRLRPSRAPPT